MRATFSGLEIAKTGLTVSQLGLDVTGHNIANVDTAGYTRQRIVNTAYDPASVVTKLRPVAQALVGGGSRIKILDQIRSSFLDRQFRTENSLYSYYNARSQGLTYVQSYFESEVESTINDNIDKFFSAIETLSRDPVERTNRVLLQQSGKLLAENFNDVYKGLLDVQNNQNIAIGVTVEEINTIAKSIAELNKSIYSYELSGENYANDLRDKRNLLLDELSGIMDIEYEEIGHETDLRLVVRIGGRELVNHTSVNTLGTVEVDNIIDGENVTEKYGMPKKYVVCWNDTAGKASIANELDMTETVGGKLKAYIDLRDGETYDNQGIPYYIKQLNNLARAIVNEINTVHREGYTYPPPDSEKGVDFFTADGYDTSGDIRSVTAGNIRLSDEVADSVFNIACSSEKIILDGDGTGLQSGNNEIIKKMYELFDRKDIKVMTPSGQVTIGGIYGYVSSVTLDMATNLSNCNDTLTNKNIITSDAQNQRFSLSGVSLDEEMTNLIRYQHAYTGASRVINAMDEAIDILINRTGRVGL